MLTPKCRFESLITCNLCKVIIVIIITINAAGIEPYVSRKADRRRERAWLCIMTDLQNKNVLRRRLKTGFETELERQLNRLAARLKRAMLRR